MRVGFDALDRLEDQLGRLAELQVGGIEQALLLLGVEQAFRRHQLEDLDRLVERPAVRRGGRRAAPRSVSDRVM